MNKFELKNLTDEELIKHYSDGNEEAFAIILSRYSKLIMKTAASFEVTTLNQIEDYYQEGVIEFFSAVKSFNPDKSKSFKNYSMMLVKRAMQRIYNASTNQKRKPTKALLSIDDIYDYTSDNNSVEDDVISSQMYKTVFDSLSLFEMNVAKLYILGYKPQAIAEKLDTSAKAVYNALQRIKNKIKDD